jgi:hypothetical protein
VTQFEIHERHTGVIYPRGQRSPREANSKAGSNRKRLKKQDSNEGNSPILVKGRGFLRLGVGMLSDFLSTTNILLGG